jgi:hypothetical protein
MIGLTIFRIIEIAGMNTKGIGTPFYMCPEIIQGKPYDQKVRYLLRRKNTLSSLLTSLWNIDMSRNDRIPFQNSSVDVCVKPPACLDSSMSVRVNC